MIRNRITIIPIGGAPPTGTLEIRSEGVFDVTDYAEVDVDIFDDTTTKTITNNGVYNAEDDNVLGYSQVTVNVPASAVDTGTKQTSITNNGTTTIDVIGYANNEITVNVPASAVDTGTKSITSNGTGIDVVGYAAVDVNVIPNLQSKTATPTTSQQTITADTPTYDGLSSVVVDAVTSAIDPNILSQNIRAGVTILGITGSYTGGAQIAPQDFLHFTAIGGNVNLYTRNGNIYSNLYYSKDYTTPLNEWTQWYGESISILENESVYMYGENPTGLNIQNNSGCFNASGTGFLSADGNIMSLLSTEESLVCPAFAFRYLFNYNNLLIKAPDLPATTLGYACYQQMFQNCTALTTAPNISAVTLSEQCYSNMFYGCTSLTTAPVLSATTLASSCYSNMFYGCTSLTTAPALPATTLASSCYSSMFQNCTALTTAPALPATTLASNCYSNMFNGCTSLTTAPALPATTLASNCYQQMFYGCTSLTTAPALPATTLASSCYQQMFRGCTSLTTAPDINILIPTNSSCQQMFYGCTSLTESPIINIPSMNNSNVCANMFQNCTALNKVTIYTDYFANANNWLSGVAASGDLYLIGNATIPSDSVSGCPTGWTLHVTTKDYFYIENKSSYVDTQVVISKNGNPSTGTTLLYNTGTNIWQTVNFGSNNIWFTNLGRNNKIYFKSINGFSENSSNYYTFDTVINVTSINYGGDISTLIDYTDSNLDTTPAYSFYKMFSGNTKFVDASDLDFSKLTKLSQSCYSSMFQGCTSLTQAPVLPATTLASSCYDSMFRDCIGLTTAPDLLATNLGDYCYQNMFHGCTGLNTIQASLPATTLTAGCYASMYNGCTSLTTAPALPATTLNGLCYSNMFLNCTSLTTAPELPATSLNYESYTGMFYGCSSLNRVVVYISSWNTMMTVNWLRDVAASGDFYNLGGATIPTGTNGIPTGWTEHFSL